MQRIDFCNGCLSELCQSCDRRILSKFLLEQGTDEMLCDFEVPDQTIPSVGLVDNIVHQVFCEDKVRQ